MILIKKTQNFHFYKRKQFHMVVIDGETEKDFIIKYFDYRYKKSKLDR